MLDQDYSAHREDISAATGRCTGHRPETPTSGELRETEKGRGIDGGENSTDPAVQTEFDSQIGTSLQRAKEHTSAMLEAIQRQIGAHLEVVAQDYVLCDRERGW